MTRPPAHSSPRQRALYLGCCAFVATNAAIGWTTGQVRMCAPDAAYYGVMAVTLPVLGLALGGLSERMGAESPMVRGAVHRMGIVLLGFGVCLLPVWLLLVSSSLNVQHTSAYLVDGWLAWPEEALGLRQTTLRQWAIDNGWMGPLVWSYGSFRWQARAAVAWHGAIRADLSVVYEVATAFALCAAVGQPLFLLLPAAGPAIHYGWAGEMPGHLVAWAAMRSGEPYVVAHLDGYVHAPSFHVVFAALLVRMWWDSPVRQLAVALNALMLWATWVVGWHYFSDLATGGGLVAVALLVVRRLR